MVDNSLTLGTALTGNYLMQSNITPASSGPETSLPNIRFQARNIMVHSKAQVTYIYYANISSIAGAEGVMLSANTGYAIVQTKFMHRPQKNSNIDNRYERDVLATL